MDAASLFQSLTSRPETPASNIITGTAVGNSEDGMVLVQVDGSAVAQPSDEEVTLTISTDEFAGGTYKLPSAPYPGTIVLKDDTDAIVDEDDYYVDGDQLTIGALDLPPVEIEYETEVRQALTNEDFAAGSVTVDSTTNLTLLEDVGGPGTADWQPCAYTLDGNELTVAGIDVMSGVVEFAYQRSVSLVGEEGDMLLPDTPDPDDVAVTGRLNGTDYVVTTWTLDGDQLTLPSGYDTFTVDYVMDEVESWNITDQYEDEPLQDSDDAADPVTVTVGHDLQHEPDTVTSCTVDGVAATYTLSGLNVVADSPTITERYFTLTYDMPVYLEVPASEFAAGAYTMPFEPIGTVTTTQNGTTLANTVSGLDLTISSLIAASAYYTIEYTAQAETDVVELPSTPYVTDGQFVDIAIVNGMPTVIGASGSGDATYSYVDETAGAVSDMEGDLDSAIGRISTNEGSITELYSSLDSTNGTIDAVAAAQVETADGLYNLVNQITADSESLEIRLSQIDATIDDNAEAAAADTEALANVVDLVNNTLDALVAYVRVEVNENNQPVLVLGSSSWPVIAQLTNSELEFLENGTPVASIGDQELNITTANIMDRITLGDWAWIPRSNGNLSLKWVG